MQSVRDIFIDVVDPEDYAAIGRAMQAVLNAHPSERPTLRSHHD
ncbi:Uncharacterised protein [Mycobacteroides abscessus subsp. abscessus]|nr:Uncharacterised protein [Mycobacteroides abscessus subsp. abscessus]